MKNYDGDGHDDNVSGDGDGGDYSDNGDGDGGNNGSDNDTNRSGDGDGGDNGDDDGCDNGGNDDSGGHGIRIRNLSVTSPALLPTSYPCSSDRNIIAQESITCLFFSLHFDFKHFMCAKSSNKTLQTRHALSKVNSIKYPAIFPVCSAAKHLHTLENKLSGHKQPVGSSKEEVIFYANGAKNDQLHSFHFCLQGQLFRLVFLFSLLTKRDTFTSSTDASVPPKIDSLF